MNSRWIAGALVLTFALAGAAPARAQDSTELIRYLNDEFSPNVWPSVNEFLGNQLLSQTWHAADQSGFYLFPRQSTIDLSGLPRFHPIGSSLGARFPGNGDYLLGVHRPTIEFGSGGPTPVSSPINARFHINADFQTGGSTFIPEVSVAADIVTTHVLQFVVDSKLRDLRLFTESMKFVPSEPLRLASPEVELVSGRSELSTENAIDILLVADGFTADQLPTFDAFARECARTLQRPAAPARGWEPFVNFDSALRIWKLNAVVANPELTAERVVTSLASPVNQASTDVSSFGNLARLAQVGIRARSVRPDVIVFVANAAPLQGIWATGLNPVRSSARAAAFGNLVLLPLAASGPTSGAIAREAGTLVHELGHTILGGLADEYVENGNETKAYRGNEPVAPNASMDPSTKWRAWMQDPAYVARLQPWDRSVAGFPGAYFWGTEIFRPSEDCKMHVRPSSAVVPFCPVCREALTLGMRRVLGRGGALIEVQPIGPFHAAATRHNLRGSGATNTASMRLPAFDGNYPTTYRVKLLAATLPRPWRLDWRVGAGGAGGSVVGQDREEVTVDVRFGERLSLEIASLCAFTPGNAVEPLRVELAMDVPRHPAGPVRPPTALRQSVRVGAVVPLTTDPANGNLRPLGLTLSAQAGGYDGWDFPVNVEFSLNGPSMAGFTLRGMHLGGPAQWRHDYLRPGIYDWKVRSVVLGQASTWAVLTPSVRLRRTGSEWTTEVFHFEVGAAQRDTTPVAPESPAELRASGPIGIGSQVRRLELSAASWDRNGDRIVLEFEVKPESRGFDGTGLRATALLSPSERSLRVIGSIVVGPLLERNRWRVRALDETGRRSAWSMGGLIDSLSTERPGRPGAFGGLQRDLNGRSVSADRILRGPEELEGVRSGGGDFVGDPSARPF